MGMLRIYSRLKGLPILLIALLFMNTLYACTNREVYDAIQTREQIKCQEVPPSEYEQCMERTNTSYETYQKQRRDLETSD